MSQPQSSSVLSTARIPVPRIQDGKLKNDTIQSWNTQNLGLRLGTDAASAATASLLVAPIICVIDQYVLYVQATQDLDRLFRSRD